MREIQQLSAEARSQTGKGPSYQTRQKGLIPGVLYGGGPTPKTCRSTSARWSAMSRPATSSPRCSCSTSRQEDSA